MDTNRFLKCMHDDFFLRLRYSGLCQSILSSPQDRVRSHEPGEARKHGHRRDPFGARKVSAKDASSYVSLLRLVDGQQEAEHC